jgi:hypothetical protein
MTDRELLELAAKAAGLEFDPTAKAARGLKVVRDGAVCQSDQVLWNPLTNDGDALRLAVKLSIELEWRFDGRLVAFKQVDPLNLDKKRFFAIEGSREDRQANTRRAIVRAAAEIGKGLE